MNKDAYGWDEGLVLPLLWLSLLLSSYLFCVLVKGRGIYYMQQYTAMHEKRVWHDMVWID